MDRFLAERIFGVPWIVPAAIALTIAVAYVVIDTSGGTTGWRWVILRWFHSLCWLLLAAAALAKTKATPLPDSLAGTLALAGGLVYVAFVAVSLFNR